MLIAANKIGAAPAQYEGGNAIQCARSWAVTHACHAKCWALCLHVSACAAVPVCAVVDAQDLLCIWGEPEGDMLPIPIVGAHFANVYPVKQLQAKHGLKILCKTNGRQTAHVLVAAGKQWQLSTGISCIWAILWQLLPVTASCSSPVACRYHSFTAERWMPALLSCMPSSMMCTRCSCLS